MSGGRYPHTTGLQGWTAVLVTLLDTAQRQLAPIEWQSLRAPLARKLRQPTEEREGLDPGTAAESGGDRSLHGG